MSAKSAKSFGFDNKKIKIITKQKALAKCLNGKVCAYHLPYLPYEPDRSTHLKKMKLENKTIWLTGNKIIPGTVLNELETENVYNHIQSRVYYKEGISEIENVFRPSNYIDKGYVCTMVAHKDSISIIFIKYKNADPVDIGIGYIERSKILGFEEKQASDLTVVKNEENKHQAKNAGRKVFGATGVIGGVIGDQFVSVNTEKVNGLEYLLYYQGSSGQKEHLTMYSSNEYKNDTTLFLNTYYKKDLPQEAQKPIEKKESSCFIATACYKDIFSEEVIFFRKYRDNTLKKAILGKIFIKIYYKVSPYFYSVLFRNPKISNKIKTVLDKLYLSLK